MSTLQARRRQLHQGLAGYPTLVVAFSGGVDSSYLLAAAVDVLGNRVTAATAVSPSLPAAELAQARSLAAQLGAGHVEVRTDEVERAAYRRNDADRCWHCKSALFDALAPITQRMGAATVAVGTITDDLDDHRPGQRAAAERGVVTPLADAGLSKADVRALSRSRGLATWDKPAAACLASRVVYGLQVTPRRLGRIERAEAWLRERLGPRVDLRVRDHGDLARIEVAIDQIPAVLGMAGELDVALRGLGWRRTEIDPRGYRSGSLNEALRAGAAPVE